MRWLRSISLICDDCPSMLVVVAPPCTPPSAGAQEWLVRLLENEATAARWSMEGPSHLAGDFCPRCRIRQHGHGEHRWT